MNRLERATRLEFAPWEAEFSFLYFQYLQNRSEKMYVHATHPVHALPGLRVAARRLRDGARTYLILAHRAKCSAFRSMPTWITRIP